MKTPFDPRHLARWIALQNLYNNQFFEDNPSNSQVNFTKEELNKINEIEHYDKKLAENIIVGVEKNKNELNNLISKLAPERPIEDIASVDLQILYITLFEGFIAQITPEKVAIDEGIELAKEFGGEKSKNFVNGVLDTLLKNKEKLMIK